MVQSEEERKAKRKEYLSRPDVKAKEKENRNRPLASRRPQARTQTRTPVKPVEKVEISETEKGKFNDMLEDLIGTRGAYVLDKELNILGKVPISELQSTLKSLNTGIYAVIFDGIIDKDLLMIAEKSSVSFLVGMDNKVKSKTSRVVQMTVDDF